MTMVTDMIANFQSLDIKKEALTSIAKTSEQYVELNREQLLHGKKADGSNMPPYSKTSVAKFGKPAGPILLHDTGKFQKSFKLDVGGDKLEIISEDLYDLAERYTDEIYGLGNTQQEYYNQEVFLPEFAAKIESQTGLKL